MDIHKMPWFPFDTIIEIQYDSLFITWKHTITQHHILINPSSSFEKLEESFEKKCLRIRCVY